MTKVKFRPSARLLTTIGEDIIKDMHAALVELVKNAYDADAENVEIIFSENSDFQIIIEVKDDGHGMTEDVVKNKWFVPSTNDKLARNISPKGRVMQGRKGIGRFAAAILAEKMILKSINNGVETVAKINWDDFNEEKYLDEIEIDVNTYTTENKNGSVFKMYGSEKKRIMWNIDQFDFLIKDLKKLLTPSNKLTPTSELNDDIFNIKLRFDDFDLVDGIEPEIEIEPFPLLDYFDYRVYGNIYSNRKIELEYHNKNSGIIEKVTEIDLPLSFKNKELFDSDIYIDFRIFDRDPEALESLSQQLSSDIDDNSFGINETKRMLNNISGVSIFRNGFRIRPYGDEDYDWLSLDKSRVQNPAQKIGANQISGYVVIESEEYSKLEEKSARDGLKDNPYYFGLISIIKQVLMYTELKRYSFRKKAGKGRKRNLISNELAKLTNYEIIERKVVKLLEISEVEVEKINEISELFAKDSDDKTKIAETLEKEIALYQGQATLGKVMDIVMHEIRKPLAWLKNQTRVLNSAYSRYAQNKDDDTLEKMIRILKESHDQLNIISDLMNRLNPLATRRKATKEEFNFYEVIASSVIIFEAELSKYDIDCEIHCDKDIKYYGWKQDVFIALTNIIENAIYWVSVRDIDRKIDIAVELDENILNLTIKNNGPKIVKDMIQSNSLFDPGISGKENGIGTGLGLPIAGEAILRNNGELTAIDVNDGACFYIALPWEGR